MSRPTREKPRQGSKKTAPGTGAVSQWIRGATSSLAAGIPVLAGHEIIHLTVVIAVLAAVPALFHPIDKRPGGLGWSMVGRLAGFVFGRTDAAAIGVEE